MKMKVRANSHYQDVQSIFAEQLNRNRAFTRRPRVPRRARLFLENDLGLIALCRLVSLRFTVFDRIDSI